ncbi:MAG: hypothetical protein C5B54_05255 [Acidobacteria bacterium]|nr:MAG: hypothetical protein C5B54_05255 [Acidobacteriota bacterium]
MLAVPARVLLILLLFCFFLLPIYGNESPLGLLLIHSVILICLGGVVLTWSRIWVPKFLPFFLPFLLSLLISSVIAPYKYSACLQLWDYIVAALFAVVVFSIFKETDSYLKKFMGAAFLISVASLTLSILLNLTSEWHRVKGSFTNPNELATFILMLIILGVSLYEQATNSFRKKALIITLLILSSIIALTLSRSVLIAGFLFATVYTWKRKTNRVLVVAAMVILVIASAIILFRVRVNDPYQYYRLKIWKYSLIGILQDPYLGIGLNMLPYRAAQFNFPADTEIGRYAHLATTADNQYLQILAECGFLGLFTFLIGWVRLYFDLSKVPPQFTLFRYAFYSFCIISFFSLPLNNTSILLFFIVLCIFPLTFTPNTEAHKISFSVAGKVGCILIGSMLFLFCIVAPYAADYEYHKALHATQEPDARKHLERAVKLNPFQPYYKFFFVSRVVDARPTVEPSKWLNALVALQESIRLNPLESDFYVYKAKIYSILLDSTQNRSYFLDAVSAYQDAINRSPYNVFLEAEFANFLLHWERPELSEAVLHKILEQEPVYLNARLLLIQNLLQQKKIEEAQQQYEVLKKYIERYKNYVSVQPYVIRLLQLDSTYKQKVESLMMHASKN